MMKTRKPATSAIGTTARRKCPRAAADPGFAWPEGKRLAISLSFDDACPSHLDVAFPLFEDYGVKATFFVCPDRLEERRDDWRAMHAAGHELGNHTVNHPCSGNFEFSRDHALEEYTLQEMEKEIVACNKRIEAACGCVPRTFAYPCGNTFVGRGRCVRSYVPLVAKHFLAGRTYSSEWHNAPAFCDLAQLNGVSLDQLDFNAVLALINRAGDAGGWLVLAGHDTGIEEGRLVTRGDTLRALCAYALEPRHGVWLDTIAAIAEFIRDSRHGKKRKKGKEHVE